MAGQEINDVKLSTLLKILAFLCGIALIAIGITKFTTLQIADPVDFFLSIYYILFGVLVCFSELPFQRILYFFSFLKTFIGKAVFLLFLGTLVFDTIWWHILVAIVLWGVAICYFILACACKSKLQEPQEKKEGAANEQPNQPNQSSEANKPLSEIAISLKPLSVLELQPSPRQAPVLPPPPPKV